LLALTRDKRHRLAWLSLASGTLRVAEIAPQALANELRRIAPPNTRRRGRRARRLFRHAAARLHFDIETGNGGC